MSHLTAPPPPSRATRLSSLANHPPSPPETELESSVATYDTMGRPQLEVSTSLLPALPMTIDSPTTRFRKLSSTLSYNSSHAREQSLSRRPSLRTSRWLVMVIPPASLEREPLLGSTLSVGPPGRYAAGILMPLFPTMYAQLSAIAREFALPSTTGVCVYLRVSEGTSQFSPRLSDESWQILWGPFINPEDYQQPPSYPLSGLPISGRIEFDIDVRKAKWFSTWINGNIRNFGGEVPETASIIDQSHWRSEQGRASVSTTEDVSEAERSSVAPSLHRAQLPFSKRTSASESTPRQGPRKLSLLDRREVDLPSIKAPTRSSLSSRGRHEIEAQSATSSHHALNTLGTAPLSNELGLATGLTALGSTGQPKSGPLRGTLSPIAQMDEPLTARQKDLDTIVRKWRDSSATIAPPVLAASPAQPNTPPVDAQTDASINDLQSQANADITAQDIVNQDDDLTTSPLNLADFTWSISSLGPASPNAFSTNSLDDGDYRLPSIHLLERTRGSVALTPSTRTSFGPDWSTYDDVISNVDRYPSPDIAARMMEDCPPTPSTNTSWGPGISPAWPFTPQPEHPPWGWHGGVLEYESWRLPSPDIAERMMEDSPPTPTTATSWGPSYDDSEIFGLEEVDLDELERARTPDLGDRMWSPTLPALPLHPSEGDEDKMLDLEKGLMASPATGTAVVEGDVSEPSVSARKLGWPYLVVTAFRKQSKMGWPYFKARQEDTRHPVSTVLPKATADASARTSTVIQKEMSVRLVSQYPSFVLYPPTYPHLELYPSIVAPNAEHHVASKPLPIISVRLPSAYPSFDLYPAGYPHIEPYPVVHLGSLPVLKPFKAMMNLSVKLPSAGYPSFNLYPAGYPHIEPYPVVHLGSRPVSKPFKVKMSLSVKLNSAGYPSFNLYPAGYPHNLLSIYPPVKVDSKVISHPPVPRSTRLMGSSGILAAYPTFVLYEPVYPYIMPYPPIQIVKSSTPKVQAFKPQPLSVNLPRVISIYPEFCLYPPTYPSLEIYPPVMPLLRTTQQEKPSANIQPHPIPVHLTSQYPIFNLYPSVYPYVIPYPQNWVIKPAKITTVPKPRLQRKTHKQLHNEVFEKLAVVQNQTSTNMKPIATDFPNMASTSSPLPNVEIATAPRPAVRSRARSGTVHHQYAPPSQSLPVLVAALASTKEEDEDSALESVEPAQDTPPVETTPTKTEKRQLSMAHEHQDFPSPPPSPEEERQRIRMELHDLIFGGVPLPPQRDLPISTHAANSSTESLHDAFLGGQPMPSQKPLPTKGLPPLPPPPGPAPVTGLPKAPKPLRPSVSFERSPSVSSLQNSPGTRYISLPSHMSTSGSSVSPRSSVSSATSLTNGTPLGRVWEEDYEARESIRRTSSLNKQPLKVKPMTPVKEAARMVEENEKSRFPKRSSSLKRTSGVEDQGNVERVKSTDHVKRPRTNDSFFQQRRVRFAGTSTAPQRSMSTAPGLTMAMNSEEVDPEAALMQYSSHSHSHSVPYNGSRIPASGVAPRPVSKLDTSRFPYR